MSKKHIKNWYPVKVKCNSKIRHKIAFINGDGLHIEIPIDIEITIGIVKILKKRRVDMGIGGLVEYERIKS